MLLVTGGMNSPDILDSTELLVSGSGSWRLATGLLPRPMVSMRVATVDNTVFLTGGYCTLKIVIKLLLPCLRSPVGTLDNGIDRLLIFRWLV